MPNENDHDILVRNTAITEQMSQQLGSALQQLARGNERFQAQDQRFERLEARVGRLEEQQVEGFARLRTDLLRAVVESGDLKRNQVETAVAPIKADLVPIKEFIELVHTIVRNAVHSFWLVLKWGLGVVTAVAIAYLIYLVVPK